MTIQEIKSMDKDSKIDSVVFKVKEIKKVESKNYNEKSWFEQALKVVDTSGKEIKIVLNLASKDKAMDLDLQDETVEFLQCAVNKYDFVNEKKQKVTVTYLKCWGGYAKNEGNGTTEEVKNVSQPTGNNASNKTEQNNQNQNYTDVNSNIARMNAVKHALEYYKIKQMPQINPVDVLSAAGIFFDYITTGKIVMGEEHDAPDADVNNSDIPF